MTRSRTTALLGLSLALAACGPLGPLPGGRLSGPAAAAPADWSFTAEHAQVELETNPADPYSVNVWCAALGERLYVPTSMIRGPKQPTEREWVRNAVADPRVRVRIAGQVYERRAVRVSDPAELEAARAALEQKYELDPAERDPEREIWIFRLEPAAG